MNRRARICAYCQKVVRGPCPNCTRKKEEDRGTAHQRGYGHKWRQARIPFLKENPWCVYCLEKGVRTLANVIDHFIPHRGDQVLFWDRSNWRACCKECHDKKTARGG